MANALKDYFERQEAFLDSFVEHGSDQELFAASYLHGHFSLIAASVLSGAEQGLSEHQVALQDVQLIEQFKHLFERHVIQAVADGEVEGNDADDVMQLMQHLLARA